MANLTLAAEEGAALTGVATISVATLAGEFGDVWVGFRVLALFGLAFSGYLGYTAYTSTPASAAPSSAPPA